MISRRILPSRTAASLAAMTSRCQLIASSACGLSSWKQRPANRAKSLRNKTSYSARVSPSIIGSALAAAQPGLQLLDDLLVGGAERALRGFRFGGAFALVQRVEQQFGGAPIALGRLVDELLDDGLAFADGSPPAILGDDDKLIERVDQKCLQVFGARGPAARIAGPAFCKTGVARRLAVAHLVIALLVSRHWRPPPRRRGRQNCGRSRSLSCRCRESHRARCRREPSSRGSRRRSSPPA